MSQLPAPPSSKIFISYRRNDTAGHAGRLYDRLVAHFGEAQVFMDIEHIEPGVDFVEAIREAVGSCVALIVLIGREWLDTADEDGRRLDDPNDFVRLEVGAALERGVRVIPVLVQGARMPRPQSLPESLVGLSRRNAVELSDTRWKYDVDELIATLDTVLARQRDERLKAAEADRQRAAAAEAERERSEAAAAEARGREAEAARGREAAAAEAARREQQEAARRAEAERREREEAAQREREEAARREKEEAARREAEAERRQREAAARREDDLRRERAAGEERRRREAEAAERRREEDASRRAAPFAGYDAPPPPRGRKTLPLVLGGLAVAAVGAAVVLFLIARPSAADAEKASLTASAAANELAPHQPQPPAPAASDNGATAATASSNTAPQSVATPTPNASPTRVADGKAARAAVVVEEAATTMPSTPPRSTPTPSPTPPPPTPAPAPQSRTAILSAGVINGKAISKPAPPYPAVAKAARAAGTVVVQVTVDEGGKVISAAAVSGHPLLRQAAVQAAYGARFAPTILSGQPVKVTGTITYNFNLQ